MLDSGSQAKAEEVVTMLIKALDGLALTLVQTNMSPAVAMTHWLGTGEPPYQFTIDRECELKSTDEMKSVVRYARHDLNTEEVRQHISGKVPTRVAMTWRDRVSFILTRRPCKSRRSRSWTWCLRGRWRRQARSTRAKHSMRTQPLRPAN